MSDIKDKVVVVTGAGGGIGESAARAFLAKDAKVVISDIDKTKLEILSHELDRSTCDKVLSFEADVSDPAQVAALMAQTHQHFGSVDILINNAGIGPGQLNKTADFALEDWHRVIAVNQSGVFYGMKYALPYMLSQGSGNIINIASLAGKVASPNQISYSASKWAVVGMTKSVALEYGRKNIRVNAVCPGYTETELLDQLFAAKPQLEEELKKTIPMNRYGDKEEITESILWLASNKKSGFMTGQALTLDGGLSL